MEWVYVIGTVIAGLLAWLIVTIKKGIRDAIMKFDEKMEKWFGDEKASEIQRYLAEIAKEASDSLNEAAETDSFQGDEK